MSITSDIRSYADTAVAEGKKVLDTAQAQLNDVTGQANDYFAKANDAVNDLVATAEKAINLDAIKSAIEPYLAQVKGYQATVTERAEGLYSTVRNDKRVAKLVDTANSVAGPVLEQVGPVLDQVQEYVVKPVQARFGKPSVTVSKPRTSTTSKPSPTKATKPAATKPAATKPAATKPAAKAKPAARKAPAKRTTKA